MIYPLNACVLWQMVYANSANSQHINNIFTNNCKQQAKPNTMTMRYQHQSNHQDKNDHQDKSNHSHQPPKKIPINSEQYAGHAQHWGILTDAVDRSLSDSSVNLPNNTPATHTQTSKTKNQKNISAQVSDWLQAMIDTATLPLGLNTQAPNPKTSPYLLISGNQPVHVNQILKLNNGKPTDLVNAFPCVNSPYGLQCHIEHIIINDSQLDAILCLRADDTIIYAHDQLHAINADLYRKDISYFVNLSAWAYHITVSKQDEVIIVDDPKAIHYHRAFNDIVANHGGQTPNNIDELIRQWQPDDNTDTLAPIEINLGHMCAYLFGDTLGQEDEAWCQGQVLGKQDSAFFDITVTLFDVVILREPDSQPFVVRMATPKTAKTDAIAVHDYIQANIWLQAAIYADNQ